MKRPLLFILTFLVLGILIGYIFNNLLTLSLFFILLIVSLYLSKKYKISFPKYLILFYVLGYFLIYINSKHYFIEEKEDINAIGVVKNIEKTKNDKYKFILKTTSINDEDKKVNILVYTKNLDEIKEGAKIFVEGKVYYPNNLKNPNGYNEKLNFDIDNIAYKMYADNIEVLKYNKLKLYIYNIKEKIYSIYDNVLPQKESNILKAMILGEKSFLDEETVDLYRTSGIYHILAISGLHIGILALFLTKIFKFLHKCLGYLIVILILIAYCIFTGASVSTVRATIMCVVVLAGFIIYKSPDFISSICLSAIILLIKNPYYLFDISFLYSYISVFSIAFLGGRFCNLYNLKGIKKAFVVSFFVSIAIKPITAYYFHNFSLLDVFLNIMIIPFMSLVVIIGFLVSIVGIFSLTVAKFLVGLVYYILRFFTYICKVVDSIEYNNLIIGKPSIIVILGVYTMLFFIAYAIYEKRLLRNRKKFINIGIIVFIISITLDTFIPRPFNLTMLDIGQGDSIVGIDKNTTFVIDGGGENNFSTGENIILPYLKSKGINSIDFVFVSHNDTDHIKGIIDILDKIKIKNLFLPINNTVDENLIELFNISKEQNINLYYLKAGDKINFGKDFSFDVLHPKENFYEEGDNNNSLVLKLKYKDYSILFTGDIEKEAEDFLLENNIDLSANILKVAHHGSKTSSTEKFINKVSPDVALISCKKNNKYKHPSQETINTLNKNNIDIYRTDENNAISIDFYKNRYKIKTIGK